MSCRSKASSKQGHTSQKDMWALCIQCVETFNPASHTVGTHVKEFLDANGRNGVDADAAEFITQAFYGCTRYERMLDASIKAYLRVKRRMNDCYTPLLVLLYLAMFRLDEIGIAGLKALAKGAVSLSTVAEFFLFIFTPESAKEHILPQWRQAFDDDYVDNTLAAHIQENSADFQELCEQLSNGAEARKEAKIAAGQACARSGGETTTAKPFSLSTTNKKRAEVVPTHPIAASGKRYRRPLEDSHIEQKVEAIHAYKTSKQLASTIPGAVAQENRAREAAIPFKAPRLLSLERPQNTATIQKRVTEEEEAHLAAKTPALSLEQVKKKMSKLPVENPKPTAATLLREESVFLRKEKEEAEVKKKKIIELRDDTEFKEWQARMQSEDERIAKAAVSQRKVDMMLADEEARAARRREEQKRGKIAARIKEDLSAEVENMKQEQEKLQNDNREFVIKLNENLEANRTRVMTHLKEGRVANARNIKEEDKLLELKAAQTLELEIQRKAELIKQIREEEHMKRYSVDEQTGAAVRKTFRRDYDPDSTMGFGTLHEMSLVELRQKLTEVKHAKVEHTATKRDGIERNRASGKSKQEQRLEDVMRRRTTRRELAVSDRRKKKDEQQEAADKQESKERIRLQALQAKLQEKREQRIADEEERREHERQRALDQQLQAADGGAIERKRWVEKERGLQNIAKSKQKENVHDILLDKKTTAKTRNQRELWLDTQINATERSRRQQQTGLRDDAAQAKSFREMEHESRRLAAATHFSSRTQNMSRHKQGVDAIADAIADLSLPQVTQPALVQ